MELVERGSTTDDSKSYNSIHIISCVSRTTLRFNLEKIQNPYILIFLVSMSLQHKKAVLIKPPQEKWSLQDKKAVIIKPQNESWFLQNKYGVLQQWF